jgi:hypothetical protein
VAVLNFHLVPWSSLPLICVCSSASQCVPVDFALVQLLSLCGVSCLQVEAGIVLELSNQKTRVFLVQIALPRWFPERAHQVFGEMPVRT